MLKILNLEPADFSEDAKRRLQQFFVYDELMSNSLSENQYSSDVIIVRLKRIIDKAFIDKFPGLTCIVTATTGTDHVDIKYCKEKSIKILCLKPYTEFLKTIPSTAEHTLALMLALVRNIPKAVDSVVKGQWSRNEFIGQQLKGKRLGIIGMGRTGKKVSKFAQAFDMVTGYYDPVVTITEESLIKYPSVEALIHSSDIISIHVHLSDDTFHLINHKLKTSFNSEKYLINTSRGKIIDEKFVYQLLKEGLLKGMATDVLENEFGDISANWLHKAMTEGANVIITPHIGGATIDALHSCEEFICNKLIDEVIMSKISNNEKTIYKADAGR